MKINIRQMVETDMDGVIGLYGGRKKYPELKWLLSNPHDINSYNSFVAVNENNEVVGVIGYVLSKYKYNDIEMHGVIPMNWMVDPDYRGLAGIHLLKKVVKLTDFGMTIGGADMGKKVYPALKLKLRFYSDHFYKVFNPIKYLSVLDHSLLQNLGKTVFLLPSYFKRNVSNSRSKDITLEEYNNEDFQNEPLAGSILYKVHGRDEINWFLNCPLIDGYAFKVMLKGEPVGVAICYTKKRNKNLITGQIVHFPHLGKNLEYWYSALKQLEKFFLSKGCSAVSAISTNKEFIKVLKSDGYYSIKRHRHNRPCFFRDPKSLLTDIPDEAFHLTFSEGDKAYRNV